MAKEIQALLSEMSRADTQRRKKIAEKLFLEHFHDRDKAKRFIHKFSAELREKRKAAVETGREAEVVLNEEQLIAFLMILRFCSINVYRTQIGDLLIEGLKYQQKDIKYYCFEYTQKHISDGFCDMGWWSRLLNKKYVSKYGWKLLRLGAHTIPDCAKVVLSDAIKFWAQDEMTQKKWQELDEEFGSHFDFVAEFTR